MRDEHAHSLRGEAPPQLPTGDDYRDVAAKIREADGPACRSPCASYSTSQQITSSGAITSTGDTITRKTPSVRLDL